MNASALLDTYLKQLKKSKVFINRVIPQCNDCLIPTGNTTRIKHTDGKNLAWYILKLHCPATDNTLWCLHACDNELCINPYHLYWGTPKDNAQDVLLSKPIHNKTYKVKEIIMSEEELERMTFAEILATVALNDEIIITIAAEDVERVKTGLKNVKAKQAAKMKEDGLTPDSSTLSFITSEPNADDDVDLKIMLNHKSTVLIKKIAIPDGEF